MKKLTLLILIFSFFFIRIKSGESIYFEKYKQSIISISKIITRQQEIHAQNEIILQSIVIEIWNICGTIKHFESRGNYHKVGESGEYGAYQYMPKTWNKLSKIYFGKILSMTPRNQDTVTFITIQAYVINGYSVKQIASLWNCGSPDYKDKIGINPWGVKYNVPEYVEHFYKYYCSITKK